MMAERPGSRPAVDQVVPHASRLGTRTFVFDIVYVRLQCTHMIASGLQDRIQLAAQAISTTVHESVLQRRSLQHCRPLDPQRGRMTQRARHVLFFLCDMRVEGRR